MSDLTLTCLAQAGWTPDRAVDPAPYVAALRADGYRDAEEAVARVGTFLGLRIRFPVKRVTGKLDEVHFDAVKAAARIEPEQVSGWAARVGRPLCPVGEAYVGHMTLTIDDTGRVFAGYDEALVLLGESVADAIDTICTYGPGPEVP